MELRINEYAKEVNKLSNRIGPMWEVGRETCNLYKSLFISRLQNNGQKHPSQVICVRVTVQLF
jgi:hypothetical protein